MTHWKRPWCWERLKAGGEGDDRRWVGWMTSLTQWTWVWPNSRRWWKTGKPGMLQSMGLQRVGHNWMTEQQLFSHWGAGDTGIWLSKLSGWKPELWTATGVEERELDKSLSMDTIPFKAELIRKHPKTYFELPCFHFIGFDLLVNNGLEVAFLNYLYLLYNYLI